MTFNNCMKAVQLIAHGAPGKFQLADLPEPHPTGDSVVVSVRACGVNRLDLWSEEGALPVPLGLPRTLGCEIAGEIQALGEKVTGWRAGDRVALQSNLFCGECEFCLRGEESQCLKSEILGVQRDGGFAEKVVVPASALVRLPAEVSFEASAALTLAGSTAVHMLTNRVKARQGDWVLVIGGASGVGSSAIQLAKVLGCYVISTASTEAKREFARNLGADFLVDSSQKEWAADVRKITKRRGVDIVVEHVGGTTLMECFACLARGGTIVTCGATAGREVTINLWPFFVKQQRLIGSYGRNREDMVSTLRLVAEGKLKPATHHIYPLSETATALKDLRNRTVLGKAVVAP